MENYKTKRYVYASKCSNKLFEIINFKELVLYIKSDE